MLYEWINHKIVDYDALTISATLSDEYKEERKHMTLINICHLPPCKSCCLLLVRLSMLLEGSLLPAFCFSPDRATCKITSGNNCTSVDFR